MALTLKIAPFRHHVDHLRKNLGLVRHRALKAAIGRQDEIDEVRKHSGG
jgi:hypothetical protein